MDRAPSTFVRSAQWGLDGAHPCIVSLALAAMGKDATASPALFVARAWTARSLTLVADTLTTPPWAPNRFTDTVAGADSLRMVWEVGRGGEWRLGDYLDCTQRPHGA